MPTVIHPSERTSQLSRVLKESATHRTCFPPAYGACTHTSETQGVAFTALSPKGRPHSQRPTAIHWACWVPSQHTIRQGFCKKHTVQSEG